MKFSSDKRSLFSALQHLGKVTPTRSTLPILSSVLLSSENGKLSLRATDLEITQVIDIPANIEEDGMVVVPHRTLFDITSELPDGELSISVGENRKVEISTSFGSYSIMGKPVEEFPTLPQVESKFSLSIDSLFLKRIIDKTVFAVSRDELKPSLMGVFFRIEKDKLQAVATDGHRLVNLNYSSFDGVDDSLELIIPVKFLSILGTHLTDEAKLTLDVSDNHLRIAYHDMVLYSRLIEERFPDFESVFPKENDMNLVVNREEILAAVRRGSIFSNKSTHQVALHLHPGGVEITTEDVETVSSARETLSCEYDGEPLVIGYNANYFRDIASHIDSELICGEFHSPVSAAIFYPKEQNENEKLVMLLMPIRLND